MEKTKPAQKKAAEKITPTYKTAAPKPKQAAQKPPTASQPLRQEVPAPKSSTKVQKAVPSPWEYTPNAGGDAFVRPAPRSGETTALFFGADENILPDWEVADRLLEDAVMCSRLFTRRVLQQKLAEPMELLLPNPKIEPLATALETLHQFLLENPNFFLDRFSDSGYLCFPGLIRSEVFALLEAIISQKQLLLHQMAAYGPEEIHKNVLMLSKLADWIGQNTKVAQTVESALK